MGMNIFCSLCMSSDTVSVLHYLSFVKNRLLRDQNHSRCYNLPCDVCWKGLEATVMCPVCVFVASCQAHFDFTSLCAVLLGVIRNFNVSNMSETSFLSCSHLKQCLAKSLKGHIFKAWCSRLQPASPVL